MNPPPQPPPQPRPAGDWLDEALAGDAFATGPHIDDAGFTARVMATLPAAVPVVPAWRRPAVALIWGLAAIGGAIALPDVAVDVARETFRLLAAKPLSLLQIAAALSIVGFATVSAAAYALRND
ncbi:MAG TPA: hypothetical protein VNE58_18615 [Casimicrobiaceae bacterium]|nr:hypothetical protein [Casimicrobiaceae bacterium]